MKRHLLISLLMLSAAVSELTAQNKQPLTDATDYVRSKDSACRRATILEKYGAGAKDNPFIDVSNTTCANLKKADDEEAKPQAALPAALGTPLIDALGTVIADRFREELTLAFLNSFREKLKNEPYLAAIFPNAKNVMLGNDPFNHKAWLASFRGALDEDLRVLPDSFPRLLKAIQDDPKMTDEKVKAVLAEVISVYPHGLYLIRNPERYYINTLNFTQYLSKASFKEPLINTAFSLAHAVTTELGNDNSNDWAASTKLGQLKEYQIAKHFVGFMVEKYKEQFSKIPAGDNSNLYDFLHKKDNNLVKALVQYVQQIGVQSARVQTAVNNLKDKEGARTYADYSGLISESLETLKVLANEELLLVLKLNEEARVKVGKILGHLVQATDLAIKVNTNIAEKEYSKIVANVLAYITHYIDPNMLEHSVPVKEFTRYANLAINLAGATTAEEMKDAIEGAALPSQSYRLKRNSYFSVSLNSFAGIMGGYEYLVNTDAKNQESGLLAFTAPLGIALNWGTQKKDNPTEYSKYPSKTIIERDSTGKVVNVKKTNYFKGRSVSIYLSLVDLGAIASFRLTDDVTPLSGIQWQNVFAPGIYYVYGFSKSPLAITIGGQYGPQLRQIKADEGVATATISSSAFRFGIGLTVDIALFHFYTKTEKVVDPNKPKK